MAKERGQPGPPTDGGTSGTHVRLSELSLTVNRHLTLPDRPVEWFVLFDDLGLGRREVEMGWVVAYDASRSVYSVVEVARGTRDTLPVHMPTLLAAVLVSGAERFMFVHNHPNGPLRPSDADLDMTEEVADAAAMCGLYFEDHLIITRQPGSSLSLKQQGIYVPPRFEPSAAWRPHPREPRATAGPTEIGMAETGCPRCGAGPDRQHEGFCARCGLDVASRRKHHAG